MTTSSLPNAKELSASVNLETMISRAKENLGLLGNNLDFDSPVWPLPSGLRDSSGHQMVALYFTTHEGGTSKDMTGRTPMSEPFGAFVKAIILLRQGKKATTPQSHAVVLRAGRYLHDTLATKGYDPSNCVPDDFVQAVLASKRREASSSAYRVGVSLSEMADWINKYNVSKVRIDFANPLPRVGHTDSRTSKEAEERRNEKLPSDDALNALAEIANLVTEPADVLRIRCVELLVCGGWRINELLTLPADCEVWEPKFINGEPVLNAAGDQEHAYGIRYFAEKGGRPGIKWMPTPMVDMARRAIADIRRITEPHRQAALWNEANPGRTWLPDAWCGRDTNTVITAREVAEVLQLSHGGSFLRDRGIAKVVGGRMLTTIGEIEATFIKQIEEQFTVSVKNKLPQYLFVMPRNWAHTTRGVLAPVVGLVSDGQIYEFIVGREGSNSIFQRFGLREADGSPIEVRSHQFRHWLNTLAQQGGMSQMEIARWSGRKDIAQNAAYDHQSGIELAEKARDLVAKGQARGPLAEIHDRLPPISREDFRKAQFATAHTTDLGMCANDWSLVPCMEHGACAACSQHHVIKGNPTHQERAVKLLEEHEFLLEAAEVELADETYGVSNFVAHNRRMRDAMAAVVAVHNDPSIEDGTLVQINLATGTSAGRDVNGRVI